MARNSGCLYGVAPVAYMKISIEGGGVQRKMIGKWVWRKKELRIVNIGKWIVEYQLSSKHGAWGNLRTTKLIRKGKKIYFEHKNKKYYLKKANYVW